MKVLDARWSTTIIRRSGDVKERTAPAYLCARVDCIVSDALRGGGHEGLEILLRLHPALGTCDRPH